MASEQQTIDYIVEQVASAGDIRSHKMFGEYALYCDEKVVGFVCDDQLFIKITEVGQDIIKEPTTGQPYPGAKLYFLISEEFWDDREYMSELVRMTADALPQPKPKKRS